MEFICDKDYEYIKGKYFPFKPNYEENDKGALINSLGSERFVRVDSNFDEDSGLDGDLIKEMILKQDGENEHLSHPVRKAMAMRLVLENTRIKCDSRDIFPAINCIDRPLDATVIKKWKNEVFSEIIPDVEEKRSYYCRSGIATIWPDYCHSQPIFERLLGLGFKGLLDDSERARRASENTAEEEEFFEGIKLTYEAVIDFVLRLAKKAEETEGSEKMAKALKNLSAKAPDSFYEACLCVYIYFMISEHVDGLQVRSLSNFDRIYYPYWKRDLERGISEDELKRELAYYLMQFAAIDNYWGQPVYLGGTKEDGTSEINPLSYIFLDVYDRMGIYNPKIQLKISDKSTPKEFILKALDMIRRGNNSIVIVNDETVIESLTHHGAEYDDARQAAIHGCYEYSVLGTFGCGMNYVNLLKPLEYAMHNGHDAVNGNLSGLDCKSVADYGSFDEFYAEYKRQLKHIIDNVIEIVNGFEDYLYVMDPLSLLNATYPTCLEKKKDAIGGGSKVNATTMMFGFLADMADSLAMIKKHVFDKKTISFSELKDALDSDFEGNEKLRMRLLLDPEKYGNNRDLPDGFAVDVNEFIMSNVHGRPACKVRGGTWNMGYHVARQSYDQAPMTASSPNGRRIGEELSKNCSASMGQNREGATAAILSVTKLPANRLTCDVPLDLGLLPSAVQGEDGLMAMYGLIKTFLVRRGHAIHINVFSPEKLRAAQLEPEKYRDLQIRVCGWNVLFNNVRKVEQDGFIRQAEALI